MVLVNFNWAGRLMAHDIRRTAHLTGLGYTVLRFTNSDVLVNADGVFDAMRGALGEPGT